MARFERTPGVAIVKDDGNLENKDPKINTSRNLAKKTAVALDAPVEEFRLIVYVSGQGSVNVTNGTYSPNEVVKITATPYAGNQFTGWTGSVNSPNATIEIVMDSDKIITANFNQTPPPPPPTKYDLTITIVGNGTVMPANGSFNAGQQITLQAFALIGYKFESWSGDISSSSQFVAVTMNSNINVTATFVEDETPPPPSFTLTTVTTGQGTVEPDSGTYADGSSVTLTALPEDGWEFKNWYGDVFGTNNPIYLTMNANKSVGALFTETVPSPPESYTLTVTTVGEGTVSNNGGSYPDGTNLTITATPSVGYKFNGWTGDVISSSQTVNVVMTANKSLTATFVVDETVPDPNNVPFIKIPITVTDSLGKSKTVFIGMDPSATAGIDPALGELELPPNPPAGVGNLDARLNTEFNDLGLGSYEDYMPGSHTQSTFWTRYKLNVSASSFDITSLSLLFGNIPNGITGTITRQPVGNAEPITSNSTFTYQTTSMYHEFEIVLHYNWEELEVPPSPFLLRANANPVSMGNVSVKGVRAAAGETVMVTATAKPGFAFANWSGDHSGTNPVASIVMDEDKLITANFAASSYTLTHTVNGSGTVTLMPSGGVYSPGTEVTVVATPAAGYIFVNWGGDASGTNAAMTVTMNGNKSVIANFAQPGNGPAVEIPITVTDSAGKTKTVYIGIDPTATDGVNAHLGEMSLPPNPPPGVGNLDARLNGRNQEMGFGSYRDYRYGTLTTSTFWVCHKLWIGMSETSPQFVKIKFGTLPPNVTGAFQMEPSVSGFTEIISGQEYTFPFSSTMYNFIIYMHYNFANLPIPPEPKQIYVRPNNTVMGTTSPSKVVVDHGTTVSITATPKTGYKFSHWSEDFLSVSNPANVIADANKNILGNFVTDATQISNFTITTTTSGNGTGTVTKSPDKATYDMLEEVVLTATPTLGQFNKWTGAVTSSSQSITLRMTSNVSLDAEFINREYPDINDVPFIDIPVTLTNNLNESITVNIGMDPSATLDVDAALGEMAWPPVMSGSFDARLSRHPDDYSAGGSGASLRKFYGPYVHANQVNTVKCKLQAWKGNGSKVYMTFGQLPLGVEGIMKVNTNTEYIPIPTETYEFTPLWFENNVLIKLTYTKPAGGNGPEFNAPEFAVENYRYNGVPILHDTLTSIGAVSTVPLMYSYKTILQPSKTHKILTLKYNVYNVNGQFMETVTKTYKNNELDIAISGQNASNANPAPTWRETEIVSYNEDTTNYPEASFEIYSAVGTSYGQLLSTSSAYVIPSSQQNQTVLFMRKLINPNPYKKYRFTFTCDNQNIGFNQDGEAMFWMVTNAPFIANVTVKLFDEASPETEISTQVYQITFGQ